MGMCGPILLAISFNNKKSSPWLVSFVYHLGRILTYGIFGILVGFIGKSINFIGLQQYITITMAIFVFWYVLAHYFNIKFLKINTNIGWNLFPKSVFSSILKSKHFYLSRFLLGALNAFLPCGMVILALAAATTASNPGKSFLYMFWFGAGTFPALLLFSALKTKIPLKGTKILRKLSPIIAIIFAIIFLLRGLNLGIPYLSPKLSPNSEKSCCH